MSTPRKRLSSSQANPGPKPAKPKPTKEELLARFKGKTRKGSCNRQSKSVIKAMINAAQILAADKTRGKKNLTQYFVKLGRENPELFFKMMGMKLSELEIRKKELKIREKEIAADLYKHNNPKATQVHLHTPQVINSNVIREMTTEELKLVLDYLKRILQPTLQPQSLQRLDFQNVIDADYDDDEGLPN